MLLKLVSDNNRAHHNRYALSITNDIAIQNNLNLFNPKQLAVSLHILPEILYRCAAKLIDYATVHCTVSHDKHILPASSCGLSTCSINSPVL